MEIPTIDDFKRIEKKLTKINQKVDELAQTTPARLLYAVDIMKILQIGKLTFYNRIAKLVEFGMFKEGKKWMMYKSDLDNYLNEFRNNALKFKKDDN